MLQIIKILFKVIFKLWFIVFEVIFIIFMVFLKGNEFIYMIVKIEVYRDKMIL